MSEATNKFIERVLAWRLPDRARLDGPEGDERALENPPGARRHGEIGGSHGGQEEERKEGGGRCRVPPRGTTETEARGAKEEGEPQEVAVPEELEEPEDEGGGREISISRGDPINDGALSDAFATGFNTPTPRQRARDSRSQPSQTYRFLPREPMFIKYRPGRRSNSFRRSDRNFPKGRE